MRSGITACGQRLSIWSAPYPSRPIVYNHPEKKDCILGKACADSSRTIERQARCQGGADMQNHPVLLLGLKEPTSYATDQG